jgi:uncharacterized protein
MAADEAALAARLTSLLLSDPLRCALLRHVEALALPDCWIGAGFIRNAVWDHLHARPPSPPTGDIDMIWFDSVRADRETDRALEQELSGAAPGFIWSVKNQARMHLKNGDAPYANCTDALSCWPETATAVAVRFVECLEGERAEILAPCGLQDLFALILRPGPAFTGRRRSIFEERVASKGWLETWPLLRVVA